MCNRSEKPSSYAVSWQYMNRIHRFTLRERQNIDEAQKDDQSIPLLIVFFYLCN